jgi:hypothetical protein
MLAKALQIADDLRPQRRHSRLLYAGAAFWMVSAFLHTLVLAITGFHWDGAVSWRKPIVFGLSMGLLLATVGWVLDRLPDRRRPSASISWTLLVSSFVEIGLITLQAWRGEASHFNTLEPTNAVIFSMMGISVAFMSVCLMAVLVWSVVERPADPLVRLAVIGGLALVMTGLGIGQWLIELGNDYVAFNGAVPDTVISGPAGEPKFPHAIAFHGIQVLIVSALMLRRTPAPEAARLAKIRGVLVAYAGMLGFASIQSIAGRAPTEASIWAAGLGISVLALVSLLLSIANGFFAQRRSAPVGRWPLSSSR